MGILPASCRGSGPGETCASEIETLGGDCLSDNRKGKKCRIF